MTRPRIFITQPVAASAIVSMTKPGLTPVPSTATPAAFAWRSRSLACAA